MTDRSKEQRFDERAALNELEQFQSEIKRYRQKRQAVTNDFEEFVRTLPSPEEVFPTENPSPPSPPRPAAPPVESRPAQPSTQKPFATPTQAVKVTPPPSAPRVTPAPPPPAARETPSASAATKAHPSRDATSQVPARPTAAPVREPGPVVTAPDRTRSKAPLLAAVLVVLLLIAGAAYWNARRGQTTGDGAATAPAAQSASPSQPAAPDTPAATAATPPDAPVSAPATGSEITTLRPVWVRVIADGERVVERELAAGARIPFTAEKTIVIRTGDAGAVQLVIRGEDQGTLGRDGAVVTRTFTVPVPQKKH